MIHCYSVKIKLFVCIFKGCDLLEIPAPTNKDWGERSPGLVCVRCGEIYRQSTKEHGPLMTEHREQKAKKYYEKLVKFEHHASSPAGVGCPMPPGPYCGTPPRINPKDD